jgi:hypothetical protein
MAEYGLDPTQYALTGVPVGTILAYVGLLSSLPTGWVPCDGRQINDAASWFNGQSVPQINQSTYLCGAGDPSAVNTRFGRNDIPPVPNHAHGGKTPIENVGGADGHGFQKEGDQCHTHDHIIDPDGGHDHGGDNRPLSSGVWFIIRIK